MVELNEPQIWTVIAVLTAALFSMMTLMSTMFLRVLRAELTGLRFEFLGELRSEIASVRTDLSAEIASVRTDLSAEIASVRTDLSAEIASVRSELGTKIEHLDRDVTAIIRREFPDPPAA